MMTNLRLLALTALLVLPSGLGRASSRHSLSVKLPSSVCKYLTFNGGTTLEMPVPDDMRSFRGMVGSGQRRLSVLRDTPVYDSEVCTDADIGPGADEVDDDEPEGGDDGDE